MAVEALAPKWTLARAEPAPFRRRGVRAVADVPLEDMVVLEIGRGRCSGGACSIAVLLLRRIRRRGSLWDVGYDAVEG